MKFIRKIYELVGIKINSKYAVWWLAAIFFIEAFIFMPIHSILTLYCINNNKKSFYYAIITTIASVIGGICAYFVGALLWDSVGQTLVNLFISQETFNQAIEKYKTYQNWVVFLGGFTPFPYKVITLSAGFCRLPLIPFIFFSILSRAGKFFLIAIAIRIWGEKIKTFIDNNLNSITIITFIAIIFIFLILKRI
ncbi:VTT domain-containing protein [Candidatus Babeliales bacterium]|nr:VTT domain-containing protein [Candidatus Babeliales bacterium]MCF7899407.1 VTT domain-containing protein [Candidatus Babeliales bacterium]